MADARPAVNFTVRAKRLSDRQKFFLAQFRKDPVITIPLSDESGQFIMLTPDIATLVTEGIIHQEYNQEKGEGYLLLTDQGRSLALHVVITHKIKKLTP